MIKEFQYSNDFIFYQNRKCESTYYIKFPS